MSSYFGGGGGSSGSSSGGYFGGPKPAAPKTSHGLFGDIEKVAHVVGQKAGLAAHDLKTIPGGTVGLAKAEYGSIKQTVEHPIISKQKFDAMYAHPERAVPGTAETPDVVAQGKGLIQGSETSLKHPLRDPFQTLMTVAPLLHVAGEAGLRGATAFKAEGVGDTAKALVHKAPIAPRLIKIGDSETALHPSVNPAMRIVQHAYDHVIQKALDTNPEGKIAAHGARRVGGSIAETTRFQTRMREVPANQVEAKGRVVGRRTVREVATLTPKKVPRRLQEAALRLTSENTTPEEALKFHEGQVGKNVAVKDNSKMVALYKAVTKRNLVTKDADGNAVINGDQHPDLATLDAKVAAGQHAVDQTALEHGLLTEDQAAARRNGPARIRNGASYEAPTPGKLGKPSAALLGARSTVERLQALHDRATESAHAEAAKAAGPDDTVIGSKIVGPGSERTLEPRKGEFAPIEKRGPAYRNQEQWVPKEQRQQYFETVRAADEFGVPADEKAALLKKAGAMETLAPKSVQRVVAGPGRVVGAPGSARAERIGAALSVAKDKLESMEAAAAGRVKPTGIVGGEGAREGRGFVSYKTQEPRASKATMSGSQSPVVGKVKSFIGRKPFTGSGLEHGKVPDNTTGLVAQHMRAALKFVNTDEFRNRVVQTGSDTRRSSRDVLVRDPKQTAETIAKKQGITVREAQAKMKLSPEVDQLLGRTHTNLETLAGHEATLGEYMQHVIPGLRDKFAGDKAAEIGAQAPAGFKWVDKGVLGDAAKPVAGQRGRIAKYADNVNSAVTALTVYFKLGHIGTRVLTNASTSIIEGAAAPLELKRSLGMWKSLGYEDRQRALAAAGQHGYAAMPHAEGSGPVSTAVSATAKVGSNWWAKHADAPFRFASIAYEARKAGFDTPAKFKDMLDKMEHPEGLDAAQTAKVEWVAKRANRSGIAYDRLSAPERNYIARGVWFYGWLAGASRFAAHTLVEHPYKSAVLGSAGIQGAKTQEAALGELPDYEQGLLALGKGTNPKVTDLSTFSPFSTPADVIQAAARPGELAGFLNPVYGAGNEIINGINQYGEHTNKPLTAAASSLAASTPESQILTAWLHRKQNQSTHMFKTTPASALARALGGAAVPRRINVAAAKKAAGYQKSGR